MAIKGSFSFILQIFGNLSRFLHCREATGQLDGLDTDTRNTPIPQCNQENVISFPELK